jgi:hypothetical protein
VSGSDFSIGASHGQKAKSENQTQANGEEKQAAKKQS